MDNVYLVAVDKVASNNIGTWVVKFKREGSVLMAKVVFVVGHAGEELREQVGFKQGDLRSSNFLQGVIKSVKKRGR